MVSSSRVNGFLQMAPSGPVVNVTCYAKSTWKRWTTNHPDHSFKKKGRKESIGNLSQGHVPQNGPLCLLRGPAIF